MKTIEKVTKVIAGAAAGLSLAVVIVMAALGKHQKPCIIYNKNGYYDLLRGMFDRMADADFMTKEARAMITFAESLEDIKRAVGDL